MKRPSIVTAMFSSQFFTAGLQSIGYRVGRLSGFQTAGVASGKGFPPPHQSERSQLQPHMSSMVAFVKIRAQQGDAGMQCRRRAGRMLLSPGNDDFTGG